MQKRIVIFSIIAVCLVLSSTTPAIAAHTPKIDLSQTEKEWLETHPVIRVHNETASPPFNFAERGRPKGFSIDYMRLIAEKIGLQVEFITGPTWDEFLGMMKSGELDVMLNIAKTPERQQYLAYTPSFVTLTQMLYTRKDFPPVRSIEDLYGKRIAVPKGFYIAEMLKSYPQVEIMEVRDIIDAMHAVSVGKADALYDIMPAVNFLMNKHQITNLKVGGDLGIEAGRPMPLHLAVPKEDAVFAGIIAKGMALITDEEYQTLSDRWLGKTEMTAIGFGLTAKERTFLKEHPVIRFTGDPDWLPQEAFTSEGQYIGIVADILDLLEARLGIQFERVSVKTWNEAVRLAETAEVDMLSETTSSGRETMTFTKPYLVFPVVLIAKRGVQPILDPSELKGKRLAVVKDYGYVIPFRQQFPGLDYLEVETVRDGLLRLAAGQADAFLSAASTASHLMSELGLTNLQIIGSTRFSIDLGFGVRKDAPMLANILNKALDSITEDEKFEIRQKWVPVMDAAAPPAETPIAYDRLITYSTIVFLILSLLAWLLFKTIKKEQIAVHFGSTWFRGIVLASLSIFVLIVVFVGWYMLDRNKAEHLDNVDENLRGILSVSEDRFDLWLKERLSYMARLGRDPELVAITKRLLQVKPNKRALLASNALREARFFFRQTEDIFSNIGFFVIDPEHISIGSMRNANLGTLNLISKQYPKLLQQAFQGQVGFVPPMTSDVALGKPSKTNNSRKPPTMFFIGPVQDREGRILAAMTLRVDPWKDFARALKSFGRGGTRETYAFDRNGIMLSTSPFEEQLRRIGLLDEGQSSALNIEIRDPGGNMVVGYRPAIERSQQPLTQMVSRALTLRQQMNTDGIRQGQSLVESNMKGYRDHRGVPVFGAWLWNADLDIGLAVEVDAADALLNYYITRTTIVAILGFTLLLSVGAILFVLIVGERTSKALMRAKDDLESKVVERTAELQNNQKQLAEAEERARMLLDSAGEGIFGVDVSGKLAFINPAGSRLLGYEPEELIGEGIHAKVHYAREDGKPYPREECPMYRSYTEGASSRVTDEVLWCKNGKPFPVEYTSMPIKKNGQVVGAVVTFTDITERKSMAEKLAVEQQRLQSILDTSPVAVGISVDGIIQYANDRLVEYFGIKEGDQTIPIYVNPEDRDYIVKSLEEMSTVRNFELKAYNAKGEVCDMLSNYNQIEYEGQTATLAWWTDITDIKATSEELKIKFDELARFRRMAIGRELKMIELKKEINDLFKANGVEEKYKIH